MTKRIKVVSSRKKRLGRGYGSGKGGHTSSRGQKGQKARGGMNILFEGMKTKKSLIKRLPLRRGKGKFNSLKKLFAIGLDALNDLPSGSVVDVKSVVDAGIVEQKIAKKGIKILNRGEVTKKLVINLPISKSAAQKVLKAGGKIQD